MISNVNKPGCGSFVIAAIWVCVGLTGCTTSTATPADAPRMGDAVTDEDGHIDLQTDAILTSSDAAIAAVDTLLPIAQDIASPPLGCPVDPTPIWAEGTSAATPLPGATCATPGWSNPASQAPLQWTDVTLQTELAQIGNITPCILWQDLTADGIADLVVVTTPLSATSTQLLQTWVGGADGHFLHAGADVPVMGAVYDCSAADLDGDLQADIVLATSLGPQVYRNAPSGFTAQTAVAIPPSVSNLPIHTLALADLDDDGDQDMILGQELTPPNGKFECHKASKGHLNCCIGGTVGGDDDGGNGGQCLKKKEGTDLVSSCCAKPFPQVGIPVLRNDGGVFTDETATYGWQATGNTYTVSAWDIDRDGRTDIFVGNDFGTQGWYRKTGPGQFTFVSEQMGLRPYGHAMGFAAADWDGDHRTDLVVTDFGATTDYRRQSGSFQDVSPQTGIQHLSADALTWASLAADLDNDGWIDLVTTTSIQAKSGKLFLAAGDPSKNGWAQVAGGHIASHNVGGTFVQSTLPWPAAAKGAFLGMAVAAHDWDGDGDLDLLFTSPPGLISLWRNDAAPAHHWLEVSLDAVDPAPDGALVQVWSGGYAQERRWHIARGFGAHQDGRLHFGLGTAGALDLVRVVWPSGKVSVIAQPPVDAVLHVSDADAVAGSAPPP